MSKQTPIPIALLLIFCMSIASSVYLGATGDQNTDVILEFLEFEELNGDGEDSSEEERSEEDDYKFHSTFFVDLEAIFDSQMHDFNKYNDVHTLLIVPPPEQ